MGVTPFKLDIDELMHEFSDKIWRSQKLSFIYEVRLRNNEAFFMQSLYAHSIGHNISKDSFSQILGGFYSLYCLHETQPVKPPFRIYLSLEFQSLNRFVVEAKKQEIFVVPALVKKILDKNMFLFGFVDINESSVNYRLNVINDLLNTRTQVACKTYNVTEYSAAKELVIKEAEKTVDTGNIKHLTENKKLIGDVVERMAESWKKEFTGKQTMFHGEFDKCFNREFRHLLG
ncbi:hypothetical protein MKW92_031490 [Papaver armeniacum]|nr:hypothetical protein MKW92_031490 [Papaver armeniacum]